MMQFIQVRTRTVLILSTALVLAACDEDTPPEARVTTLSVIAGNNQEGTVGSALPQGLVVRALDGAGAPVRGARVVWAVATGGGSIATTTDRTDQDGRATATWTLGTGAGEQTATATIGAATTTFEADAQPGPAATLTVQPGTLLLDAIDATGTLGIAAEDQYGNDIEGRTPTWLSLNTGIVSVTAAGVVRALTPGTARVRATLEQATGEAEITVDPAVASVDVDPDAPVLPSIGSTVQLQARALDRNGNVVADAGNNYVWSSAAQNIVSVNNTGLARAEGAGSTQIMAALGNVVGQVTVSVAQVATSIDVSPNTDTLTTAAPTVQLSVVARDANNNIIASPNVTWSTANSALATVSNTGLVTGQSNGIVHIRAVSGTARDSARITVLLNTPPKPNPDSLGTSQNTTLELDDPGLLLNDSLGIPKGVITSFGGGDLGGSVSANDAGEEVTFGTGGSLVVNEDGSLEFTPSTNFTGEFEFLYRVSNSAGAATATVTIHVGIAPTAVDDNFATPLNTELSLNAASGVLSNDQSGLPTGQLISFGGGSLAGDAGRFAPGSRIAYGIGGSIRVNADGSLVFRPPTGFTGPFTFFYRLGNSAGTSDALVTITVN